MANYNLPKHASNRLAIPIPGNIQKILWIVILSVAMLILSATAVYANSATADDNVSDAPPHEQISDPEESTEDETTSEGQSLDDIVIDSSDAPEPLYRPELNAKYNNNSNAEDGFNIIWRNNGSTTTYKTTPVHYVTLNTTTGNLDPIEPFWKTDVEKDYAYTTTSGQTRFDNTTYQYSHFDVRYYEETFTDSNNIKWAYSGSYVNFDGADQNTPMTKMLYSSNNSNWYYYDELNGTSWTRKNPSNDAVIYIVFKNVSNPSSLIDLNLSFANGSTINGTVNVEYMYHDHDDPDGTAKYDRMTPPFAADLKFPSSTSTQPSQGQYMEASNFCGRYIYQTFEDGTERACVYDQCWICDNLTSPNWVRIDRIGYDRNDNSWRVRIHGENNWSKYDTTKTTIYLNFIYESNESKVAPSLNSNNTGIKINCFDYDTWADSSDGNYNYGVNANTLFKFSVNGRRDGWTKQNQYTNGQTIYKQSNIQYFNGAWARNLDEDGFPILHQDLYDPDDPTQKTQASMKYLLDPNTENKYRRDYTNLNGFFDKNFYDNYHYYLYASNDINTGQFTTPGHFAQLRKRDDKNLTTNTNADNMDFVLYNEKSNVEGNRYFMPFDDKDNPQELNSDFLFGMTIETNFFMPSMGYTDPVSEVDQGGPMVFHFNGDDDVFVYIDNMLMLDLGGIHQQVRGDINFYTGKVLLFENNSETVTTTQYMDELARLAHVDAGDPNWKAEDHLDQWEKAELKDGSWDGHYRLKSFTTHKFNFYYFERGSGQSNCEIAFNLQTMPEGTVLVTKQDVVDESQEKIVPESALDNDFYYMVMVQRYDETTETYGDWVGFDEPIGYDEEGEPIYPTYKVEQGTTVIGDNLKAADGGIIHIKNHQRAILNGFKTLDKFKVAECDPKGFNQGDMEIMWKVYLSDPNETEGWKYLEEPNIEYPDPRGGGDIVKWYGSDEILSGVDNRNAVVFSNHVNLDWLFDLKITKEESNNELSKIFIGLNGQTFDPDDPESKPVNTDPYVGKYDIYKGTQLIKSKVETADGNVYIEDGQTIIIHNLPMKTRATIDIPKPRLGTFNISNYNYDDPSIDPTTDWKYGDMSKPYPPSGWEDINEFTARIPIVRDGDTLQAAKAANGLYGEIKFSETNVADDLTITKAVTAGGTQTQQEEQLAKEYTLGAILYSDTTGTTPVTSSKMQASYDALYYQDNSGTLTPVPATVTIDYSSGNEGQILIKKNTDTGDPYMPKLKNTEKIVIYGLFPKENNPVKSIKLKEENLKKTEAEWTNWHFWTNQNSGSSTEYTPASATPDYALSNPYTIAASASADPEPQTLGVQNIFTAAVPYTIPFSFYQKLQNNTTKTMLETYTYSFDGDGPIPEGVINKQFSITGGLSGQVSWEKNASISLIEQEEPYVYTYTAQCNTEKPTIEGAEYTLDAAKYTIKVSIDTSQSQASAVTVSYYKDSSTSPTTDHGWTHTLNGEGPSTYEINFNFYQVLKNHTNGTMQQDYTYKLEANQTPAPPMPETTTIYMKGGEDTPATGWKKTTTEPISETVSYSYKATLITELSDVWYELDPIKEIYITVTINPTATGDKVTYAYTKGGTTVSNATWTHEYYGPYTLIFDFYQELKNNTTNADMQQDYNYIMDADSGTPPMPSPATFEITGGTEASPEHLTTPLTVNTTAPIKNATTYYYKAYLTTTEPTPWYVLDKEIYKIAVTITPAEKGGTINYTYSKKDGTVLTNIKWHHELNPEPEPVEYTIPFELYQKLVNLTEEPMEQKYHYVLIAVEGAPMPEGTTSPYTFTITGGEDDPIPTEIPDAKISLSPDSKIHTYRYTAVNTDEQKERYALEKAPKTITVSIDTSKDPAEAVSVNYASSDTWTHYFNPVAPTPTPEDISQTFDGNKGLVLTLLAILGAAGIAFGVSRKRANRKYAPKHVK